jgi:hypothetical protein
MQKFYYKKAKILQLSYKHLTIYMIYPCISKIFYSILTIIDAVIIDAVIATSEAIQRPLNGRFSDCSVAWYYASALPRDGGKRAIFYRHFNNAVPPFSLYHYG